MAVELKELEQLCQEIGRVLTNAVDQTFGAKQVGFMFLLFDFGAKGHMTYVSNADRVDMIHALQEAIEVLEQRLDQPVQTIAEETNGKERKRRR